MISRNVPLVDKVKREIVSRMSSANFVNDQGRLPSEEELSRQFGVSRSTIRSALASLEESGLVTRRHGVGTYLNDLGVAPGSVWGWLDEASTFEDLIRNSSHVARTAVLEADFRLAGASAGPLDVAPEAPVLWVAKLFYSDENPVLYSAASIPLELLEPARRDLAALRDLAPQSVYAILETYFNAKVHHQVSDIRAGLSDEAMARRLEYKPQWPILALEEVGYDAWQKPLYHGAHYFRADLVSFRVVRRPVLTIDRKNNAMSQP
jgi:GntR family transcriptional regulator